MCLLSISAALCLSLLTFRAQVLGHTTIHEILLKAEEENAPEPASPRSSSAGPPASPSSSPSPDTDHGIALSSCL